ncbi:MAG: SMP-30/gluconolactonase/LRE family protein [Gammaproteobacteria bacterium]|nr:SMP-30/gluconolactonase/LRE family protein [Gammaproteobacteria bacterium]
MTTDILLDGLCFGEGPRWHEGRLWLSDMHAHEVLAVSTDGEVETIVEIPNWPSGLGWLPNGDLLVVSMTDRCLLRYDGTNLTTHADLSGLASFHCNDMVVAASGRAYVGNFGFDLQARAEFRPAELICVDPDGSARIVAEDLRFPNGSVITPDGKTLIVGETFGSRLTAFDIQANGNLENRRVWAELPEGAVPDGICLDAENGIWSASPASNECIRQTEGGQVTHRVDVEQGAFACMLGGEEGNTLFILTSGSSDSEECPRQRSARVETFLAPYPHAGLP